MQTHLQQAAFNYETHKHCKHWNKRTAAQYFEKKCFPGEPSSTESSWGLNSWLHQHGLGRKGDTHTIKLRDKINALKQISCPQFSFFSGWLLFLSSLCLDRLCNAVPDRLAQVAVVDEVMMM